MIIGISSSNLEINILSVFSSKLQKDQKDWLIYYSNFKLSSEEIDLASSTAIVIL